jgi:uncharacterized protein (DUF952 family)
VNETSAANWIVHLCSRSAWQAALRAGEYHPPSLETEGFIHCSRPGQIVDVANLFFPGVRDLALLWIDPQQVRAEIRWDAVGEQVFPHIYGPLNLAAVLAVGDFSPGADGVFRRESGL